MLVMTLSLALVLAAESHESRQMIRMFPSGDLTRRVYRERDNTLAPI